MLKGRGHRQGSLEPLEAGGGRKNPPLETLEGAWPWDSLILDFWSPEPCYLKLAVLGHFLQWPQDTHTASIAKGTKSPS